MTFLYAAAQDNELYALTQSALNRVIGVVAITLWVGILAADILFVRLSFDVLLIAVVSVVLCLVCWQINQKNPYVAALVFVLCTLLMLALAAYFSQDPIVFGLFTILVLVSASLLNLTVASLVTIVSCASIAILGSNILPQSQVWLLLVTTTSGLFISASVSQTSRSLLEKLHDYQRYSLSQLEASRDSRGELARAVKALTEAEVRLLHLNTQLRYARSVAEEARRLKVQFATNVSHELRTPINLIVGFSEIIAVAPEIYGIPLAPNYRADIQAIYRNARHLQNLINDILDIAQVESGRLAIVKEETDPLSIINEAMAMTRELVESKGLELKTNLPANLPVMLLDRTRIRQVLLNLLANAARFTDRGSITVQARLHSNHLQVSVADTGIGISEENIERVFDEFFQVDGNTSRRQGGTGLGLALSKQFITQHGGHMWAESKGQVGLGTIISFTLPVREAQVFNPNASERASVDSETTKHIVVFDSDANIIQLFKGYSQHHRVYGSSMKADIAAFLSNTRAHHVIVADRQGIEEIKDMVDSLCPSATIITCPIPSGKRLIHAMGVSDYLVKPVSRQSLLDALAKIAPSSKDILIIDDDRDVVRMYRRMLQTAHKGWRIRVAYSGREGMYLMREKRPDLVILDIMMPDVDGYSVIQLMNKTSDLRDLPVLVISARDPGDMISEYAHGEIRIQHGVGYKPIELVQLIEAIARAVSIPVEPTL